MALGDFSVKELFAQEINAEWLRMIQNEYRERFRQQLETTTPKKPKEDSDEEQLQRNMGMNSQAKKLPSREWLKKMADKEDAVSATVNQQEKIAKWRSDSKIWKWHHNYGRSVSSSSLMDWDIVNYGGPAEGARSVMTLTSDGIRLWTQSRESKLFADSFAELMKEGSPYREMFTHISKHRKQQEERYFGEKVTLQADLQRRRKKERPNASIGYSAENLKFESPAYFVPQMPLIGDLRC